MFSYAIIAFFILTSCSPIVFLCYWIPKKLGSAKTGKIVAWLVGFTLLCSLMTVIFEDQLFTKANAKNLLLEQKIVLNDPFEIVENKSMLAIGDYYHTFTLKLSNKDRLRLIKEISASEGFKKVNKIQEDITQQTDRYTGNRITQNYETEAQFIREYFEPNGKGYAPTYRKIEIDKNKALLVFEDIDK
jgi:hypothetical protein